MLRLIHMLRLSPNAKTIIICWDCHLLILLSYDFILLYRAYMWQVLQMEVLHHLHSRLGTKFYKLMVLTYALLTCLLQSLSSAKHQILWIWWCLVFSDSNACCAFLSSLFCDNLDNINNYIFMYLLRWLILSSTYTDPWNTFCCCSVAVVHCDYSQRCGCTPVPYMNSSMTRIR